MTLFELQNLLDYSKGLIVLLDRKRNNIGYLKENDITHNDIPLHILYEHDIILISNGMNHCCPTIEITLNI